MITEEMIKTAISVVEDPELNISLLELGLIYGVEIENEGKKIRVTMTLTSIGCPVGPQLRSAVYDSVAAVEGVEEVEVDLTFDPPWDPYTMASEDAKLDLGII